MRAKRAPGTTTALAMSQQETRRTWNLTRYLPLQEILFGISASVKEEFPITLSKLQYEHRWFSFPNHSRLGKTFPAFQIIQASHQNWPTVSFSPTSREAPTPCHTYKDSLPTCALLEIVTPRDRLLHLTLFICH